MNSIRISALATAALISVASLTSAMGYESNGRYTAFSPYDVETTGSFNGDRRPPAYFGCPMSSAAEGNANQPSFPVQQYGQTSGGNRC
ncbi:hypothetical protein [Methylobacterium sp. Leaf117]|uniref:hypothetical protein n=1 Tax=Methylobacterium sp. Leaf117 TaxID=1736260 RepID=UPI001FCD7158|nr:hypothetical protein [Methylobacterium sp. Leaf117]